MGDEKEAAPDPNLGLIARPVSAIDVTECGVDISFHHTGRLQPLSPALSAS